jgi:hypothetical protein
MNWSNLELLHALPSILLPASLALLLEKPAQFAAAIFAQAFPLTNQLFRNRPNIPPTFEFFIYIPNRNHHAVRFRPPSRYLTPYLRFLAVVFFLAISLSKRLLGGRYHMATPHL